MENDILLKIIGIPGAIILLITSPFAMCSQIKEAEAKRIEKLNDPRSAAEKAGAKARGMVKDFGKGLLFGGKNK